MAIEPVFARPPCVIPFSNESQFFNWLLEHGTNYVAWEKEDRSKLWKEVVEGDAVYGVSRQFSLPIPVRCICVIAARVMMLHPIHGWMVLVEYKRRGDQYEPRQQQDSSLSEKMLLDPLTGLPIETPVQTMIRCLQQETGMIVSSEELVCDAFQFQPKLPTLVTNFNAPGLKLDDFGRGSAYIENDFAEPEKFPTLMAHRQVAKYKAVLHHRHYRKQGYHDPQTRYYSFWRKVHEQGLLRNIPAHVVLKRKQATA